MDKHFGYSQSERSDSGDYRNGYKPKKVNSSYGSMEIQVPQDRKSSFEATKSGQCLSVTGGRFMGN